jgi:glycerol-3-phosphate dehydrogenase (NAD(P)+)
VGRVTVFGAGAMGTAIAMHLARSGQDAALWASEFDARVLDHLRTDGRHPALPEHLPESLSILGPDDLAAAGKGLDLAVLAANSGGARSLARLVRAGCGALPLTLGVAKGLEPGTALRMSQVYTEEIGHDRVVAMGGPCLASEIAQGLPSAAVFGAADRDRAEEAAALVRSEGFRVAVTDDVLGVEYCTVAKNVAAIGLGILDGLGKEAGFAYRNARAAIFALAVAELGELIVALGGRPETAIGLAGVGDTLVTSLGGRNRLYGELVGEGAEPKAALDGLVARGMTVEGVESARDVAALAEKAGVHMPFHAQVSRVLFDGEPAASLLTLPERMNR